MPKKIEKKSKICLRNLLIKSLRGPISTKFLQQGIVSFFPDNLSKYRSQTKSICNQVHEAGYLSLFQDLVGDSKNFPFCLIIEHFFDQRTLGNTLLEKSESRRACQGHFFDNQNSQNKHFLLPYGLGRRLTWFVISQG